MRKLARFAAAILAAMPGLAHAQEPACLSPKEFSSLASYALPNAITGVAKRCASTLPADSFLRTDGLALAQRYAVHKDSTWPGAKAAFLKLNAGKQEVGQVMRSLSDSSLREMIDVVLEGLASQEVPLEKCGTIDTVVRLLAPLPAENTAELLAIAASLGAEKKAADFGDMKICKGENHG